MLPRQCYGDTLVYSLLCTSVIDTCNLLSMFGLLISCSLIFLIFADSLLQATSAGAIVTPTLLLLLMPFGWRRVFQVISLVGLVAASAAYVLIINEDSLASKVAIDNQTTVTVVASPAAIFAAKDSMDDGDKSKIEKKEESITRQPENYSLLETLAFNVEVQFVFISAMFAYFALTMLTDWLSLYLAEYALQNMEQTTELLVWLEVGLI